jgi:hypothetical protein
MATVRVKAAPQSSPKKYSWQVLKGGERKSWHKTKEAAVNRAKSLASKGDHMYVGYEDRRRAAEHKMVQ